MHGQTHIKFTIGRIIWISVSILPPMVARGLHWSTALQAERWQVRFPKVSKFFRPQYGPVVNSSSNRNKFQEYFWPVVQGGRCVELTNLPPLCVHVYVSKSGNLSLLELSGPVMYLYRYFFIFFTKSNFHTYLYIYIPTNCTQLIYFINNTLKHMYCLKL